MATESKKRQRYVTPTGEAVWPWINRYDDRPIKGKPQKPAYKLNLRYDAKSPEWLAFKRVLDRLVEESYEEAVEANPKKKKVIVRQYPYVMEVDDDGEETGKVILKLKQTAFIPAAKNSTRMRLVRIDKFLADGTPLPNSLEVVWDEDEQKVIGTTGSVAVYSGSLVKASFTTRNYLVDSTNSAGVSLDFGAVQVIKLVAGGQRSAESYGFDVTEDYAEDNSDESPDEKTTPDDPTDF